MPFFDTRAHVNTGRQARQSILRSLQLSTLPSLQTPPILPENAWVYHINLTTAATMLDIIVCYRWVAFSTNGFTKSFRREWQSTPSCYQKGQYRSIRQRATKPQTSEERLFRLLLSNFPLTMPVGMYNWNRSCGSC